MRRSIRKINDPISELIVFGTKFQYFTIEITNRALQAKYKSQYKCFNARRHSTNAKKTQTRKKCRKKMVKKEEKKKLPSLQSKNCERKMYDEKLPLTITFERKQWLEYLHYARISISLKFCNVLSLVLMLMIIDNGVFFLSVLRL